MNLQPLVQAPLAIKIHLATVIPAFVLGTWLIFRSAKGGGSHRALGWVYLGLMTVTAIAAIFIHSLRPGHFSLLHLFVPLTLFSVVGAVWNARRHNIRGHQYAMLGLYFGGLILAGLFALMPGRLIFHVVTG